MITKTVMTPIATTTMIVNRCHHDHRRNHQHDFYCHYHHHHHGCRDGSKGDHVGGDNDSYDVDHGGGSGYDCSCDLN